MKKIFIGVYLAIGAITLHAQSFQQQIKIFATDRAPGNQFGYSVAVNGNFAVVGAAAVIGGDIQNAGECAYVFQNLNGTWTQTQKLIASDKVVGNEFGHAVSISGNFILIGAPGTEGSSGAVYIFERNAGGSWEQVKKIVAPDKSGGDMFGSAVSISGKYAVVGAPNDADYGSLNPLEAAGSAYFLFRNNGNWEVLNKVAADLNDRSQGAGFGFSVAISGTSAVIGAPYEKKDTSLSNPFDAAGAVYAFERNANGTMQLVHKIVDWSRDTMDYFGYSVAINGNTILVGAPWEDEDLRMENPVMNAGSVHIFERKSDNRWWWAQKLIAKDRGVGDNFGHSVSLSGNTAVIGTLTADEAASSLNNTGAAYVFLYDGNLQGWTNKQIKIVAPDRADNDWFGLSVAVDGEAILVGAPLQDRNNTRLEAPDAGAAYFFEKTGCSPTSSHLFASACKKYTSPSKKYKWDNSGSYYDTLLNKAGCDSIILVDLTITGKADTSVTVKGNTLTANVKDASYQWIDCATNQPININTRSLIATVNGSYKVKIDQEDGCAGVSPCYTVKPNPPIVLQPLDPPVNTTPVSYSQLKEFIEINKLVPKDRGGYENFGYSVAISGDYAVIGANVDDKDANGDNPVSDAGSAYIFKKDKDGKWKEVQKIIASDRADGDNFGWSVAISLNHIVVGAIYHDKDLAGNNSGPSSGAAYIFERSDDGVWVEKQKIIANPLEGQILFGHSVAIDGNTIAVGSPWYAKDATGRAGTNLNGAGAVFVFDKIGGKWVQSQIITPKIRTINNLGDGLGSSVSICGDLIIAGAWGVDFDDKGGGTKMEASGAAYIFERSGGIWKEVQKIVAGDRAPHDQFGYSVAISGDNAIIGAWNKTETTDPNSRPHTGNAYIFSRKAPPNPVRPDGRVILVPEADGKWRQLLKISPEDRRPDDYLGWSVGMSGDYAIVSAMKQDTDSLDNLINDGGAIYVFYQDKNGRWSQAGKLATFDRSQLDNFGHAVAINGCDIIGGTIIDQEDDKDANALTSAGSAYIFSAADCRNVAPCYRPKLGPGDKTPIEKKDSLRINIPGENKNATKANMPEKIKSPDLNSKGNEVSIDDVELNTEGLKPKIKVEIKPKTDSVNKTKPARKN